MGLEALDSISPYVRSVRIDKVFSLAGEWTDTENVFTYIESGSADFILNGTTYELQQGDALIIYPLLKHYIKSTSVEPLIQYIFSFDLCFDPLREEISCTNAQDKSKVNIDPREQFFADNFVIAKLDEIEQTLLKNKFLLLHKEYYSKDEYARLAIKGIVIDMLTMLLRSAREKPPIAHREKNALAWANIEKAVVYIRKHFSEEALSNEQIGRAVQLSPNYLVSLFKSQLGVTMHRYLNCVRVEEAKKLMQNSTMNFTQIAQKVGFSDTHVFCKTFKKLASLTPGEFKRTHTCHPGKLGP